MDLVGRTLTFIGCDPPRHSWFAAWDPNLPGGLGTDESTDLPGDLVDVEVLLPATRGTHRTTVRAERLPIVSMIDELAQLERTAPADPSAHAWAAVTRAALALIADAKVLPWVSPDGWDTWRIDPLSIDELETVDALAAGLPTGAHATPIGSRGRLSDPRFVVRAAFDAIADAFIRTPAAHRIGQLSIFADPSPTRIPHLRPWVDDLARAHGSQCRLVLRMVPPRGGVQPADDDTFARTDDDAPWTVHFELQSRSDPSLIVDASRWWEAPNEVLARIGSQAEAVLLTGLASVAELVEPLSDLLDRSSPSTAQLHNDDIDALLDALDGLLDVDIDVRWPSELLAPTISRRLVVSSGAEAPQGSSPSLLDLASLLEVDWEFLLEGSVLTRTELEVLAAAKRSIVPLRGRWVRLDRATLERLRAPRPKLSSAAALAVALGGAVANDAVGADDDEAVEIRLDESVAAIAARLRSLGAREAVEPDGLRAELRGYQRRGLGWMSDLVDLGFGGCLADDMGLGKTIQVLALHASREPALPSLVICPTSLLRNWQREAARFIPDTPVVIHHGSRRSLVDPPAGALVLTTYGIVRSDIDDLSKRTWGLIVADEAQHAKNPRSKTARALRQLQGDSRIALTGTPIENRLSELWSIIDWVVPGLLGPLERFRRTLALPIERDGDERATDQLRQLVQPFLLRRTKSDPGIAPELPAKIERDVVVPLTPEQVTLYRATVDESLAEVAQAEGINRKGLVLKLLTGLKQITNHPAQYLSERGPLPDRSGKLAALDELLDRNAAAGESTLVFTQYVAMGKLIVAHCSEANRRVELLHGGLTVAARQELVDRFQRQELDALVLSLKAGGTGLNLTAATHVVHYDRWWNPAVEDQATDRAHRIGQKQTVTVHRLITEGTIEDRVGALLDAKRALADRVTGGESWIGDLDDDELAALVALPVAS